MRELELKEKKIKEIQNAGDRLLREDHPARPTVEVGWDCRAVGGQHGPPDVGAVGQHHGPLGGGRAVGATMGPKGSTVGQR